MNDLDIAQSSLHSGVTFDLLAHDSSLNSTFPCLILLNNFRCVSPTNGGYPHSITYSLWMEE